MSGVPMPDSVCASHSTGGKFAGTLKTVVGTPARSSSCQKATPSRRFSTCPSSRGIFQGPTFHQRCGSMAWAADR